MTEYKGIKGGKVRNYDTDPNNPYVGQLWYNETLGDLRVRTTNLGSAWATGGNLNTARRGLGGAGVQTATLAFGGSTTLPAGPGASSATELYNGISWTSNPTGLNTARSFLASAGTNTAALAISGLGLTTATQEWNAPYSATETITLTY